LFLFVGKSRLVEKISTICCAYELALSRRIDAGKRRQIAASLLKQTALQIKALEAGI